MMEAAAIETESPSPPTSVSQGQASAGASLPSTSAKAGAGGERRDRARHGQMRGLADVEQVDLVDAGLADADDGARHESRVKRLALCRRQLLGIVQAARDATPFQDHRRGHHRPGKRAAAGFVHAGDGAGRRGEIAGFGAVVGHRPS